MATTPEQLATAARVCTAVKSSAVARMASRFRTADDRLSRCVSAVAAIRARDEEPSMGYAPGGDPADRAIVAAVRAHYDTPGHVVRELDARLGGRAAYVFGSLVRTSGDDGEAEYVAECAADASVELDRMDTTYGCIVCGHEQDHKGDCDSCDSSVEYTLTELAEAGDPAVD